MFSSLRGFDATFYKEVIHIQRDRTAIIFAFVMPLLQMVILGTAIDTNIRQIPTAIYDLSGLHSASGIYGVGSSESRAFIDRLRNSDTYRIDKYVYSDQELNAELISGRARVGIKIPVDFSRRLLKGEPVQVLVLVDGSDSSVAGQAMNVANQLALDESLQRLLPNSNNLPFQVRPKIMFNPDSRSPNFFLPGLMAVLLLFVTTMLTAFSIVREKERGTLEQLYVTPIQPLGLMLGKITPYFILGMGELCVIVLFMHYVFRVPINGNWLLLLVLSPSYLFVNLALGTLISTKANSQAEAMQMAMMSILPSIFLSGYIFPRETMPVIFYLISYCIPATYMVNISRGVILRGAGFGDLWLDSLVLLVMGLVILSFAARRFTRVIV